MTKAGLPRKSQPRRDDTTTEQNAMGSNGYNVIVEVDQPDSQLEFQNFSGTTSANVPGGRILPNTQPNTGGAQAFGAASFFDPPQPVNQQTAKPASGFWTVEYYAKYFDINTNQVLERMIHSVLPRGNFLDVISTTPDLYGPFWIATTVIFAVFVTSSLSALVTAAYSQKTFTPDFEILSFAVATIYIYAFAIPLLLWGATKYYKCAPHFLEIVDLYGYGLTVWIPISFICVVPIDLVRWPLVALGFATSGFFMTKNMYPVLARSEGKTARAIIIAVLACHAALSLIFKLKFFSYKVEMPEKLSLYGL